MTEKGKKPGTEAASQPDPLSATGMFLNAFAPQPEPSVEPAQESPAKGAAKPAQPGEFTQMFHKLEPPPSPPVPQTRSTNRPPQEPGEFTRTFVAAATSPGLRPAPATPDPATVRSASCPENEGLFHAGRLGFGLAGGQFHPAFPHASFNSPGAVTASALHAVAQRTASGRRTCVAAEPGSGSQRRRTHPIVSLTLGGGRTSAKPNR